MPKRNAQSGFPQEQACRMDPSMRSNVELYPSKRSMYPSQQEESVSRTDEVATNAPAKLRRARTTKRRGWTTGLAALASALGLALVPALGATPAGATGPTLTTLTGHGGATAPALGVPVAEGSAQVNPTYVAYNSANGDTAIASTKAGSVYVYLIAGASEANEYNIQTGVSPATFGSLTAGNVYVMAGTGTAGLIAEPGNNQFGNSTSAVATQNPIEPTSVAFDQNGNVLIAGAFNGASAIQVVAKTTGTFYGVSMTAGDLYTIGDVGLSGAPSSAINMGSVAGVANGMSVDPTGNILVGDGDGVIFVNEQSSGNLSLYGLTIGHQSATVIAGTAQGGTDCTSGAANDPANSLYFQSAAPFVDSSDNVYFSDNENGGVNGGGCAWVEPAQSGTFDGMSVTAGNVYKLAGNGGSTATPDGTAGINANVNGTSEMTLDAAGNVVLVVQSGPSFGTSPAVQVLAESTGTFYGTSMTAGDLYTVAGGPSNKLATLSGPTSVLNAGSGNLLFTDGAPTSANLDELSGGPTAAVPTVTNVAPSTGAAGGGTSVTITGTNLTGATAVKFGANAATGVIVNSATSITATSPTGTGTVDVTVTTPGGTSATSGNDQFTYVAGPTVTNVAPGSGPTAGGTSVTITGTALTGATAVHFGANAATGVVVNSDTSVSATSPAGSAGTVDVTVTTPVGTSPTSANDKFIYAGPPVVTGVNPNAGPLGSGTSVTISGTSFTGATAVHFGANAATGVVVNSATSITATAPSGSAGTVDVTVTTPGGTSATSSSDHFTYDVVPAIASVAPGSGPAAGGTSVTITGSAFTGATAVHFGANAATGVVVNSATSITATAPSGSAGTVDVTVTTPGGTSATSASDHFTYIAAPAVASVAPSAGPAAGGTSVTITGTAFTGATAVHFGANAATGVVVNSATSITATSPSGTGTVDVTVTTPGGTSATSGADQFIYVPPPPAPPAGATQSNGASSDSSTGTATASLPGNSISASGTGVGAVTVSQYGSDPTTGAVSGGTGVFYDVEVAPGTTWTTLTITVCSLGSGGQSISWWNGSAWLPFSNQSFNSSTGCVTATVNGSTSPTLAQLTGTPIAATVPLSGGYWSVASDGGIFSYGDAQFYGSTGAMHLNKPIVGMAPTPDGKGYWLVASDGGIFSYGDAQFYGSTGAMTLNKPIVGMAPTPSGKGYWLVASDGGIFSYGDATFFGSTGAMKLNKPVVGMASTHDGKGYWLVASDGGIFNYGDAVFDGSTGAMTLNKPIVGMAPTLGGNGYWLVASDGGIFNYGDAPFEGSAGSVHLNKPIVGMSPTADGKGYWLVASDGGIFNYGDAAFDGSAGGTPLNQPIVGIAEHPEGG